MVLKVKDTFSKEINQLKFKNANISAFQDLIAEEMRQRKQKDKKNDEGDKSTANDYEGLTSVHHIAAEAAIFKWKQTIIRKRIQKQ